jgi:SAM-dependent methyltransferase
MMNCPLCDSGSAPFFKGPLGEYNRCTECLGIFLLPQYHLSSDEERTRYEKHNNDVKDLRYQGFVQHLVDAVKSGYEKNASILDYGCGTGPVISYLLEKDGYETILYDPYFQPDASVFEGRFDVIILSEVMEHFLNPKKEFVRLFSLLRPGGKIFCLTELYDEGIDFSSWHYKNDETHVFFYHRRSIEFIAEKYGRDIHSIYGRLIII